MSEMQDHQLTHTADRYLDYYNHSPEAYEQVCDVLNKFEFLVELAMSRAIQILELPDTPQPLAIVLPFKREHNNPRDIGPAPAV